MAVTILGALTIVASTVGLVLVYRQGRTWASTTAVAATIILALTSAALLFVAAE